jgi:hypothetical protein
MKSRPPTLEGFRLMLLRPYFGLAEIAWRWSFGAAVCVLLGFSFFEYLDTLPVTAGDLLLLRTRQPALISEAIAHILHGSAPRVVETIITLAVALTVGWIVLASCARAATINALLNYFREAGNSSMFGSLRSLIGLNFFRAAVTLAAGTGSLAALVLSAKIAPANDVAPGSTFLVFLSVVMLVWIVWSSVNWFLSLAGVCAVVDGQDTFGAIASAVVLYRRRAGSVWAAGIWFGLAHGIAFVLATSIVAFPLGLAGLLPGGIVLGGVLLVALLYFAVADFLHIGRIAAYVAILELPEASLPERQMRPETVPPRNPVDPDELILSDLPSQA